jgi:hypothetical protein
VLIIPIELLVLALVALGTAALALVTAQAHASWLPSWLKSAFFFVVPLAEVTVRLAKWLTHKYGETFFSAEARVVKWFVQFAHYQYVVGYWSLFWPVALHNFGTRLLRHEVPTAIDARTKPLAKKASDAVTAAQAATVAANDARLAAKANGGVVEITQIKTVAMPHAGEWGWIHDHFNALKKTVAAAAAGAIGIALPHAPSFPIPFGRTIAQIKKRLRAIEYVLGATGAAVLVARAIGGVSANCVKKGNIGRFARRLCGLGPAALEDLLGLLADVLILQNICTVITVLEDGLSFIEPELTAFIATAEAQFVHCKYNLPANEPMQLPYLPALTGVALYTP